MAGVPQFGNWENDGSVPYSQYFERARKGKGGAKATPEEDKDSISTDAPPVQPPPLRTQPSPNHPQATDPYERASRKTVGWDAGKTKPERSVESSPLSQHTPGTYAGKAGSASPYQSKVPPERSHDQTPEKVTAVPKFGDWDETDPSGGAGFTEVFRRVKDERNNPSKKAPYLMKEPDYSSPPPKAQSGFWSWLLCFRGK